MTRPDELDESWEVPRENLIEYSLEQLKEKRKALYVELMKLQARIGYYHAEINRREFGWE